VAKVRLQWVHHAQRVASVRRRCGLHGFRTWRAHAKLEDHGVQVVHFEPLVNAAPVVDESAV
jgi:hypothetical protein